MDVFARRSLTAYAADADSDRLLLEGSWPTDDGNGRGRRYSLDELIDARFGWIDRAACEMAAELDEVRESTNDRGASFFHVNALRLRYAAAKWLRVLAWRRTCGTDFPKSLTLHVSHDEADDEYVALFQAVAAASGSTLSVRRYEVTGPMQKPTTSMPAWRRLLARTLATTGPAGRVAASTPRVMLCGNPRILDPVCRELLHRGATATWLHDRFAVRAWLRWSRHGVTMRTCDDATLNDDATFAMPTTAPSIRFDGIELGPAIQVWRRWWEPRVAATQHRQATAVERHIRDFAPTHLVVDEDATPLPRAAVAAARRFGAATVVVQHGACGVRFGFAPQSADRIVVADEGSRRQLLQWDVERDRIIVAGSPARAMFVEAVHRLQVRSRSTSPRRILLLGTTPPRDDRPDAVTFRLTTSSYEAMLHAVMKAMSQLSSVELLVRPHPRTGLDSVLARVLGDYPHVATRMTSRSERLEDLVARADGIISCASSAGIDAHCAGRPVVQLLPVGSGDVLPAAWYGLRGTARTGDELLPLLRNMLSDSANEFRSEARSYPSSSRQVASRVVDAILSTMPVRQACSEPCEPLREAAHA